MCVCLHGIWFWQLEVMGLSVSFHLGHTPARLSLGRPPAIQKALEGPGRPWGVLWVGGDCPLDHSPEGPHGTPCCSDPFHLILCLCILLMLSLCQRSSGVYDWGVLENGEKGVEQACGDRQQVPMQSE